MVAGFSRPGLGVRLKADTASVWGAPWERTTQKGKGQADSVLLAFLVAGARLRGVQSAGCYQLRVT